MSASKTSIGRSDVVLGHRGSSLLHRSQCVLAIVVLILSVVVIPVCGQLPPQSNSSFLLVIESAPFSANNIIRVPLDGGQSFRVYEGRQGYGIDHDCVEGRFYWGDSSAGGILSAKYDGTDRKPFITEDRSFPNDVAVDWISRRLYWAEANKETIEVASLDNPDVRTVVISANGGIPSHVAVDPFRGKLYWILEIGEERKIEWSNLDGTKRQLLVESPLVQSPISVQVFNATGELCYTDGGATDKIDCINPISKKIRTIASNLTSAVELAITEELFYWTNQFGKRIESINMKGVRQKPITSPLFENDLLYMTLVSGKCTRFYSPCAINNGDCPKNTICLVNSSVRSGQICKRVSKGN